jgi:hypothetical protein
MQTTIRDLFNVTSLDTTIETGDIILGRDGNSTISFSLGNRRVSVTLPNIEVMKLLQKIDKMSKADPKETYVPDRPKTAKGPKEQEVSQAEMSKIMGAMGAPVTPTPLIEAKRKITCPLTGEKISSEKYQENKKNGVYAGLPKDAQGRFIPKQK